jgi:hypothetical protein
MELYHGKDDISSQLQLIHDIEMFSAEIPITSSMDQTLRGLIVQTAFRTPIASG